MAFKPIMIGAEVHEPQLIKGDVDSIDTGGTRTSASLQLATHTSEDGQIRAAAKTGLIVDIKGTGPAKADAKACTPARPSIAFSYQGPTGVPFHRGALM